MSSEMIERVARAIRPGVYDHRSVYFPAGDLEALRETARDIARRAIEAMRAPPEEVMSAGSSIDFQFDSFARGWDAAIDAALSPSQGASE